MAGIIRIRGLASRNVDVVFGDARDFSVVVFPCVIDMLGRLETTCLLMDRETIGDFVARARGVILIRIAGEEVARALEMGAPEFDVLESVIGEG